MAVTTRERPGLVTFAAIMMFIAGGFALVTAIEEFSNAVWLNDLSPGLFGKNYILWAIVDFLLALVAFYAGFDIWRGGNVGRWLGMAFAIFSAVRWFFLIWWVPIVALIVITIDILILFGLAINSEYFEWKS